MLIRRAAAGGQPPSGPPCPRCTAAVAELRRSEAKPTPGPPQCRGQQRRWRERGPPPPVVTSTPADQNMSPSKLASQRGSARPVKGQPSGQTAGPSGRTWHAPHMLLSEESAPWPGDHNQTHERHDQPNQKYHIIIDVLLRSKSETPESNYIVFSTV